MGETLSMSSRQGGSRYPSAFGHTPTYRSYASIPDASIGDLSRDLTRELGSLSNTAGVSAFNRTPTSLLSTDLSLPSVGGGSSSSSAAKVQSYSSSTAALVVTEVAQLLNTPLTQRTNLQLLVLAVFPTLLMDTLLQTTLAKIHTKTESLLIPITSN